MPLHALHKGQRAEREILNQLQDILDHVWERVTGYEPPKLERRTLGLSGADISGLEWLSLEVKHREVLALKQWWEQTVAQSQRRNGGRSTPVLAYKQNNRGWRIRMPGFAADVVMHATIVDIELEAFLWWFYYRSIRERDIELDHRGR